MKKNSATFLNQSTEQRKKIFLSFNRFFREMTWWSVWRHSNKIERSSIITRVCEKVVIFCGRWNFRGAFSELNWTCFCLVMWGLWKVKFYFWNLKWNTLQYFKSLNENLNLGFREMRSEIFKDCEGKVQDLLTVVLEYLFLVIEFYRNLQNL